MRKYNIKKLNAADLHVSTESILDLFFDTEGADVEKLGEVSYFLNGHYFAAYDEIKRAIYELRHYFEPILISDEVTEDELNELTKSGYIVADDENGIETWYIFDTSDILDRLREEVSDRLPKDPECFEFSAQMKQDMMDNWI